VSEGGVPESRERTTRLVLLATLVTVLAFLPSLAATFVYDDLALIARNPYAKSLAYLSRGFRTHLWDVFEYGSVGIGLRYYRPVVSASYILNWVSSGGAPWAFHLVNVLGHGAATWLAARLATRWTGDARLGFLAAVLFGIHPSRTESVIWVSGRTDVLMALFMFGALELAWSAAHADRKHRSVGLFASAVAVLALAVLSKEAAAATALLVAVDRLVSSTGSEARKRLASYAIAFASLGALYVSIRSVVYPVGQNTPFELTPRYGLFTVAAYFERIVFPWPQTFFYRPAVAVGGVPYFDPVHLALGALLSIGFLALAAFAYRRDRVACLLLVSGAVFLGPLLNFTYTGIYVTTSDHFLYVPVLLWAAGLLRLFRRRVLSVIDERPFRLAAAGALLLFAAVDLVRVLDYRDDATFWNHELALNPNNPIALAEVSRVAARNGDIDEAYAVIKRAIAPESTRYFLLAGSRGSRIVTRARVAALAATLKADGDARGLEEDFQELEGLLSISRSEYGELLGPTGVLKAAATNAQLAAIVSDTALVATRIGRTQRAQELANAITGEALWHTSNPLNLVLVYARLGDFAKARRTLSRIERPPSGVAAEAPPETFAELRGRLREAETLFIRTKNEPEDQARLDSATAYGHLGAYLHALRVLRPAFERAPNTPGIAPLYVQLLVSARLDDEALATAKSLLGPARGAMVVEELRSQLSPRVRALRKPVEPAAW
jgi:tetratricopeptide (TPR) repeat protein